MTYIQNIVKTQEEMKTLIGRVGITAVLAGLARACTEEGSFQNSLMFAETADELEDMAGYWERYMDEEGTGWRGDNRDD